VKTAWLQIRVTPAQKEALRSLARCSGSGLSGYVLARALPAAAGEAADLAAALRRPGERSFALAGLHDFLEALPPGEFAEALAAFPLDGIGAVDRNRVAAMVETAAARKGVAPPAWAAEIPPLDRPVFASALPSLRAHLLRASPAAFRRRNLFVDATLGDRA
jgi:hypothetical protein